MVKRYVVYGGANKLVLPRPLYRRRQNHRTRSATETFLDDHAATVKGYRRELAGNRDFFGLRGGNRGILLP